LAAYSWARSFFSCRSPKNAGSLDGFQVFGTKAAGKAAVQMGVDNFDGCYKCNKTKGEKRNGQPKGKPVNWKLARTTRKE